MIKITLPDGSVLEKDAGVTGLAIAEGISDGLARMALAINVNGEVWDLGRPIDRDARVQRGADVDEAAHGRAMTLNSTAMGVGSALTALSRAGYIERFDVPKRRMRGTRLLKPQINPAQLELDGEY